MSTLEIFVTGVVIILSLVLFLIVAKFFNLWLRARIANSGWPWTSSPAARPAATVALQPGSGRMTTSGTMG